MKRVLLLVAICIGITLGDPIVKTKYGDIQGFEFKAKRGSESEVFLGIPFAKPPIGGLRFEKPQPPDPWEGILEAKKYTPPCIAWPDILNPNGKEDCLYLNIIRPKQDSEDSEGYPVMVFIHGGAFIGGSSLDSNYERAADRLVSKGVVFASLQYRLGAFGFYSSGDSEAPGNYGIWDQVQALRFLQEVLKDFGGNPSRVTIFGESAGGASTSILSLVSEAEGLFSQSIPMSGSALAGWAIHDRVLGTSQEVEKASGCSGSSKEKISCLKTKTSEELIDAIKSVVKELIPGDTMLPTSFNPRADGELLVKNLNFDDIYSSRKKKPTFIGVCSMEDIMFAIKNPILPSKAKYFPMDPQVAVHFNESTFREYVHFLLSQNDAYGDKSHEAIEKIINFYIEDSSKYTHHQLLQSFTELFSDIHFNVAAVREALLKTKHGYTVYFYLYDFTIFPNHLIDGAPHGADVIALFGGNVLLPDIPLQGDFETTVNAFTEVFVNFAKTGTPKLGDTVIPKVENNNIPVIRINQNSKLEKDLWNDKLKFWDSIRDEYGFDWPSAKWAKKDAKEEL